MQKLLTCYGGKIWHSQNVFGEVNKKKPVLTSILKILSIKSLFDRTFIRPHWTLLNYA